jgi:hypothetical protein
MPSSSYGYSTQGEECPHDIFLKYGRLIFEMWYNIAEVSNRYGIS